MIITPGPVVDFLISNQNVRDPFQLDWAKVNMFSGNIFIILHWSSSIRSDLYIIFPNRPKEP